MVEWLNSRMAKWLTFIVIFTLYLLPVTYFLDAYFIHLPVHNSNFWRYGYREAVSYITEVESKYEHIIFEQSFNQPYIYFLFYQKYNPASWQKQSNLVDSEYKGDVGYQTKLDNIEFKQIDWSQLRNAKSTLVVLSPNSVPPEILNDPINFAIVNKIQYLNKIDTAFDFIATK
jgi:hypothetical protein